MLEIRKSEDRGVAEHGWLSSRHSFSFGGYHDPAHTGFGPLLVINEDRVQPGRGFGKHGHRDMEIISYVLEGKLAHSDSMGNGSAIGYGDVQRMSAGTGIMHSEYNDSAEQPVHFLQIWIEPDRTGIAPGYEEKAFAPAEKKGRLRLIASPDGEQGSVLIHQNARIYASILDNDPALSHELADGRAGYVHVAKGSVMVNGRALQAGDALKITDEKSVVLENGSNAEVLVFDLPAQF